MQKTHESTTFERKSFPVVLVLDSLASPANMGSLFRLADAFNIEKLIFCKSNLDLQSNRLRRTARATVKNIIFEEHESTEAACTTLQNTGYTVMALEIASGSIPLQDQNYRDFKKIALVVGNERAGIEENVLKMADKLLHINMFGENSSMNVTHAAAIALFEITKSLPPVR